MSAILFIVATITLAWLLIVSPGVIRQHRMDVQMRRWEAVWPQINAQLLQMGEAMKAVGYAADIAAERFSKAFTYTYGGNA